MSMGVRGRYFQGSLEEAVIAIESLGYVVLPLVSDTRQPPVCACGNVALWARVSPVEGILYLCDKDARVAEDFGEMGPSFCWTNLRDIPLSTDLGGIVVPFGRKS